MLNLDNCKTYGLSELYSEVEKKYYNHLEFISFLRENNYSEVRKIFPSLGLKDNYNKAKFSFLSRPYYQLINFLELYSNASISIIDAFRTARINRKEIDKILSYTNIVFSSNPVDIATMSMRGIRSCMSWDNYRSSSLAGSIIDPYCAIIYLSSRFAKNNNYCFCNIDKNILGPTMLSRAVVRCVLSKDNIPHILLEKVYTNNIYHNLYDISYSIFMKYLKHHSKYSIISTEDLDKRSYYIPEAPEVAELLPRHLSYRDSAIKYLVSNEKFTSTL